MALGKLGVESSMICPTTLAFRLGLRQAVFSRGLARLFRPASCLWTSRHGNLQGCCVKFFTIAKGHISQDMFDDSDEELEINAKRRRNFFDDLSDDDSD